MTHYDTLGVPRDASADDIRKAYRTRAQAAHPDKGGSHEDMQSINEAYACLSEPERRALYDEDPAAAEARQLAAAARQLLQTIFSAAVDAAEDDDWLTLIGRVMRQGMEDMNKRLMRARARHAKLSKRSGKIRAKTGENLMQLLIERRLADFLQEIETTENAIEVHEAAAALFEDYEEDRPAEHPDDELLALLGMRGPVTRRQPPDVSWRFIS